MHKNTICRSILIFFDLETIFSVKRFRENICQFQKLQKLQIIRRQQKYHNRTKSSFEDMEEIGIKVEDVPSPSSQDVDLKTSDLDDLYSKYKKLQQQLEFLQVQEEYIKVSFYQLDNYSTLKHYNLSSK